MIISVVIIALVGLAISGYAYMVEQKIKADHAYKPMCDLSDKISCSKPIASEYGQLFGVTNSLFGIVFYASMVIAAVLGWHAFIFYGALASCIVSVFLAYILYFKIRVLCLICTSIYVVNILLLIAAYMSR